MNIGDVVSIYEDPLTEEHLEGEGTILEVEDTGGVYADRKVYRVQVRFEGDRFRRLREVLETEEACSFRLSSRLYTRPLLIPTPIDPLSKIVRITGNGV